MKLGIDPTAPDIHLGHVVVLDKLRAFQDRDTVVLIIGDFTARVGDPSGPAAERPVLTEEQIAANAATFQEQAFKVLDPDRTEVRRNGEWLAMGTDELFRLVRRFTVARLLEREEFAPDGGGGARSRRWSSCIRCFRATTRSRSRPTSRWAGPTRSSTCCSVATSRTRSACRRSPFSRCRSCPGRMACGG